MNVKLVIYMSLLGIFFLIALYFIWKDVKRKNGQVYPYVATPEREVFQKLSWLRSHVNEQEIRVSSSELGVIKQLLSQIPESTRWIFIQDMDEIASFLGYKDRNPDATFPIDKKKTMYAILSRCDNAFVEGDKELAHKYFMQAKHLYTQLKKEDRSLITEAMNNIYHKIQ
jgi:hypothetical protein